MRPLFLTFVLFSAACGADKLDPTPPDASTDASVDLGVRPDVGFAEDASSPADQGVDGGAFEDAAVVIDAGPPDLGAPDLGAAPDSGATQTIGERCFGDIFDPNFLGPNYDQFGPTMGSHCMGTNHQTIDNIERVVFLGDSVTVGTPPTQSSEYYRSRLADLLAAHFGIEPPSGLWKRPNLIDGTSMIKESGAFASCSHWGARADDLLNDDNQISDCFPPATRNQRTLVVMTMGGNDIASITKDGAEGKPVPEVWQDAEDIAMALRQGIEWFYETPDKFPNGVQVIFANPFEFTDSTGDVNSCPAAAAAGFDEPWADPQALEDIVIWLNEQYMDIAVTTQTDMIMLLEHFCGHGYHHDDPNNRCYRGPTAERWFDISCIHPNPTGHQVIADMFMAVVRE